jgi:hypothetical protein
MSEIFKERVVESPVEPEIALQRTEPSDLPSDTLKGNERKVGDPLTEEQKILEIWEGEHKRKFVTEYFDIGNIDGEFNLRMDTSVIDKYIKNELENRKYEKNTENWEKILQEIEMEIGSQRMELFSRIKKIVGYIKAVNRLEEAKKKKELYLSSIR